MQVMQVMPTIIECIKFQFSAMVFLYGSMGCPQVSGEAFSGLPTVALQNSNIQKIIEFSIYISIL